MCIAVPSLLTGCNGNFKLFISDNVEILLNSQYQALDGKHHAAIHYDQERINEMMSRLKLSQDQIEDLQNKLTVTQNEVRMSTAFKLISII